MVSVQWIDVLSCISAYCTDSTEAVCELTGIPSVEIVDDEGKRVYTILYVKFVRGVEKHCGSGVTKGKSHSVNGNSLQSRKESGPVCQYPRPYIPGLIIVQKYRVKNLDVDVINRKLLIYFSLFQVFFLSFSSVLLLLVWRILKKMKYS